MVMDKIEKQARATARLQHIIYGRYAWTSDLHPICHTIHKRIGFSDVQYFDAVSAAFFHSPSRDGKFRCAFGVLFSNTS